MSSTNKTTYYELSQYVGTDKPTYLSDYNGDMLKIDTGIHDAATDASTALTTANSAASAATTALTNASAAVTTANSASATALEAKGTAETASTNASAALTAAAAAETAAEANTIGNLAPAYDPTLTYEVDDLCTFVNAQGSGKLYKCIIPVETPEAFNINKWDDVTTSEVYARKSTLVSSITTDGIMTYKEMFNALINNVDIDYLAEYLLVVQTSSTHNTMYHEVLANNGLLVFTFAGASTSELHSDEFHLDKNGGSSYTTATINSNGFSSVDKTNNVATSGKTWQLFKINTL